MSNSTTFIMGYGAYKKAKALQGETIEESAFLSVEVMIGDQYVVGGNGWKKGTKQKVKLSSNGTQSEHDALIARFKSSLNRKG